MRTMSWWILNWSEEEKTTGELRLPAHRMEQLAFIYSKSHEEVVSRCQFLGVTVLQ